MVDRQTVKDKWKEHKRFEKHWIIDFKLEEKVRKGFWRWKKFV